MMKNFYQNILSICNSSLFITVLFSMFGSALIFAVVLSIQRPQKIGTVNIIKIIRQFIKNENDKNVEKNLIDAEVKIYAKNLEKNLNNFAKKHHLILMPKEAIIAGSPDYTDLFLHEYKF